MAKPTFRDRFYTPPVAHAITSPLGIVAAGAGLAVGIAAGLPIVVAVGIGGIAYAVRVAAAIPKGRRKEQMNPFSLQDPWRTFVWEARKAQRQFGDAVAQIADGPLHEHLSDVADRIETGVDECWRVAQAGQALANARSLIDVGAITKELGGLPAEGSLANAAVSQTAQALQSQLQTAKRMDEVIASTRDRLRLLDARLGELVSRVLELSVRPQNIEGLSALDQDVNAIVGEMEALRQALDETDNADATARSAARASGSKRRAALPQEAVAPAPPVAPEQIAAPQQAAAPEQAGGA